jgi:serine/threonine protein kinase
MREGPPLEAGMPPTSDAFDAAYDRFEAAWKAALAGGPWPRIEDHLPGVAEAERPMLLRELIRLDLYYRGRLGERAVPEDYRERFPTLSERWLAGEIRQQFPPEEGREVPGRVGSYRVGERIGGGGMGEVYRAFHENLGKWVAIKLVRRDRVSDPQVGARLRREMKAGGLLDHPNIVRVTDAGEEGGILYLVMELVEGLDLAKLVRQMGPLPTPEACELARQAALGLQCAHAANLVHRDVKPSNLMLSKAGQLKILDLGLVRFVGDRHLSDVATVSGMVMGTLDYMAPEQWEASHKVDIRADLYSLGCTLFTLLAGHPPFCGPQFDSPTRKMAAHLREPPPPIRTRRPEVPEDLAGVLGRLLAKHPDDRYRCPEEAARALESFTAGADLAAFAGQALARLPRPAPPTPAAQPAVMGNGIPSVPPPETHPLTVGRTDKHRPGSGYRWAAAVAALVVLLTGAAAASLWFWWGDRSGPQPDGPAPEPGGWKNLLARSPGERLWVPALDSRLDYDPKTQYLLVQNAVRALVPLGETNAGGYRLQVGFRQLRWQGYFGMYFGGRKGPDPDTFHFQFVALDPTPRPNAHGFMLIRSTGAVLPGAGARPRVSTVEFASAPLTRPLETADVILEFEVKPRGLVRVRWNGDDYPALVADTEMPAAALKGASDRGEFGVYCWGTNVTVSTARFLQTE